MDNQYSDIVLGFATLILESPKFSNLPLYHHVTSVEGSIIPKHGNIFSDAYKYKGDQFVMAGDGSGFLDDSTIKYLVLSLNEARLFNNMTGYFELGFVFKNKEDAFIGFIEDLDVASIKDTTDYFNELRSILHSVLDK